MLIYQITCSKRFNSSFQYDYIVRRRDDFAECQGPFTRDGNVAFDVQGKTRVTLNTVGALHQAVLASAPFTVPFVIGSTPTLPHHGAGANSVACRAVSCKPSLVTKKAVA